MFHFHYIFAEQGGLEAQISHLLGFGWVGVNIFFALSGFLITGILIDSRHTHRFFQTFYMRRVLRIFPLYYCFLAFVFLLNQGHYLSPVFRYIPTNWAPYLLYLQNFLPAENIRLAHLWSLAIEEQFYLLWPAVIFFLPRRRVLPVSVCLVLVCLSFRLYLLANNLYTDHIFYWVFTRLDELVMGSMVAVIVRNAELMKAASLRVWWLVALASLGMAFVFTGSVSRDGIGLTAVGILSSSAVFLLVCYHGPLTTRFFTAKWLRSFGTYGYGIYVLHPTLYAATSGAVRGALLHAAPALSIAVKLLYIPLLIVLSFWVGKLSFVFLEQPFNGLKRFFPYHDAPPRQPAAEYAPST